MEGPTVPAGAPAAGTPPAGTFTTGPELPGGGGGADAAAAEAERTLAWLRAGRPPLERLRVLWQSRDPAVWRGSAELHRVLARQLVGAGEPFLAHDVATEGLQQFPGDLGLRQLRALALAQTGATTSARALLEAMVAQGQRDSETLSLLARTHKDLWRTSTQPAERRRELRAASSFYLQAFEATGDYYPGVNAASLALLQGRRAAARALAERVRRIALAQLAEGRISHWLEATLGEVALVLGDLREATDRYLRMGQTGQHDMAALCSSRRQARVLLEHLGHPARALDACFGISPIVVFTATPDRLRGSEQPGPNLPDVVELRQAVAEELERCRGRIGYASADSLADLIFFEELLQRSGEIHMVLPFPPDTVRAGLAQPGGVAGRAGGRDWGRVFDRILASAASVTVASPQEDRNSPVALAYAERLLLGLARLKTQILDADFRFLWVDGTGRVAAADDVPAASALPVPAAARRRGRSTSARAADHPKSGPPPPPRAIRALLFADIVGYSRLTEWEIPIFLRHFLHPLAGRIESSAHAPTMRMTWGDAVYLGFDTIRDGGRFALELRDFVASTPWRRLGLGADLRVRIGLHAGPVFVHQDPVVGRPSFAGSHVTQTARIEPIAEEGQIYASESFAALAATETDPGFAIDYVGEKSMAKNYGRVRVYIVRPGR